MTVTTAIYWAEAITALGAIAWAYIAYRSKKQEEAEDSKQQNKSPD